jgi:hypothetical protein
MKVVKKNVYYCDHCNKRGLAAIHMRKHEGRCTANPRRFCGTCENAGINVVVEALLKRFTLADNPLAYVDFESIYNPEANNDEKIVSWLGEPVTLEEVRRMADGCPSCILAVLRQTGLNRHYFHLEKFDFKKELADWMSDHASQFNNPY